ncbi:flagellar basal body-associated FliL family protein [Candidatus Endoriftia persephone]|jgi:flagellar FliL protein|uniref:Flagellar protein FliL n=3 Tax=Gammaproteobacteria TaxID=1236 RepID=G2FHR6_9GAMM|nr:flagellar basal body-associated FliL family protein [Candidatus Endoriftia persephone]EGW53710.1 flagellar biosynthesis protein FliL [endosymbiont of Tevnia jerichonana (vent Tica)]USF86924.1 flagellar basal body-associated FliL family protein [Candidatus Endoriftia persephone]
MAKDAAKEDLELGDEKPGKKKLIIIIAVATVLLLGGGAAAYFLLMGDEAPTEEEVAQEQEQAKEEEPAAEVEKGPPQYHALDPVFVVNLPGKPSLIQVGVTVRVRSDQMVEFLKHNDPMIRHHFLDLLGAKDGKVLKNREAKEALQREMLDKLNGIVKELDGPGEVEALYFTNFVMQ